MPASKIFSEIKWTDEVDSTNSAVLRKIDSLPERFVLAARLQTDGRGQRGNRWVSAPGENLTFSVLLKDIGIPADDWMALSESVSVAVVSLLEECGIPDASVKWPNDIIVHGRKIAGILIENALEGKYVTRSIIGIGLDVNQEVFPPDIPPVSSMALETGRRYDIAEILDRFIVHYTDILQLPREEVHRRYISRLFRFGKASEWILPDGRRFMGTIKGVLGDGRLEIVDECGGIRRFAFKEVVYSPLS